ncbi:GntR family transcriptional regulator [Zafaria sp. Z1313]|uniref:GntR family transcriptional regulator n=1 Tax=unclassified Zafaria TaxID=2828765 RepID=UPI002E774A82|nr:GntR family transcriptional regulator [Zafaria sp. J156]MEE1620190.1 GntR family transcriptional regulator [Zafaria sp. J156]
MDDVLDDVVDLQPGGAHPYEQIRQQVIAAVRDGRLVAGTRLPSVRALAGRLGVAVNTVARSYRELEALGVVRTRGRNGTLVQAGDDDGAGPLADAAAEFAALARQWGVDPERALAYVRAAFEAR